MFDPYDPSQMNKLHRAVAASHRKLGTFRKQRRELIEEYAGADYGTENTAVNKMPVNMMAMLVDIYLMHLAGNGPRIILPTPRRDILPFVADLEAVVNQELQDMKFDATLRKWVLDAIFCIQRLCGSEINYSARCLRG